MTSAYMQGLMLGVQILALIGLIWYAIETNKIRRAAQQQVQSSLDLIRAATDQVEGMSKPCLTFLGELRNDMDAVFERHDAIGNVIVCADQGHHVIQNIGNGVALNIQYSFNPSLGSLDGVRYIPQVMPTGRVTLVERLSVYNETPEVVFDYESIGGIKYRTTIQLNHQVITKFVFEEIQALKNV